MQKEKIIMPKLGESVTEGTINTWLVKEGDKVHKYDPIADVMTDKVNAEVPSSHTGVIKEIIVAEGEAVEVGELICYIETEAENTTVNKETEPTNAAPPVIEQAKQKGDSSLNNRYSPAVLKLAQDHDIDLSAIEGTGLGGRITRKDVKKYIQEQPIAKQQIEHQKDDQSTKTFAKEGDRSYRLTGVRKVIADNMSFSKSEIPHAWLTVEVDVTDLVKYRDSIKEKFKAREGINLTYFSFFVHAVSKALKEFPVFNSVWKQDHIIEKKDINMSIAVAKDNELFVPVIKQANLLNIAGIAREIDNLAKKARTDNLTAEDMDDGTFTLNNSGSFGSISSMGIINYPQVAILQVESIVKRPVIIDDMFAARDMVNLSLSLDHRVLDGLICGKFLARIKELLEGINEDTISV